MGAAVPAVAVRLGILWNWVNPDMTRFMEIRQAELQAKDPRAQLKKQWVDYGRISIHLKRALIVAAGRSVYATRRI